MSLKTSVSAVASMTIAATLALASPAVAYVSCDAAPNSYIDQFTATGGQTYVGVAGGFKIFDDYIARPDLHFSISHLYFYNASDQDNHLEVGVGKGVHLNGSFDTKPRNFVAANDNGFYVDDYYGYPAVGTTHRYQINWSRYDSSLNWHYWDLLIDNVVVQTHHLSKLFASEVADGGETNSPAGSGTGLTVRGTPGRSLRKGGQTTYVSWNTSLGETTSACGDFGGGKHYAYYTDYEFYGVR